MSVLRKSSERPRETVSVPINRDKWLKDRAIISSGKLESIDIISTAKPHHASVNSSSQLTQVGTQQSQSLSQSLIVTRPATAQRRPAPNKQQHQTTLIQSDLVC